MEDYDPDLDFEVVPQVGGAVEIDPAKYQHYIDLRRTRQHLPLAVAAGVIGALLGAVAWLGLTAFTSLQVGWMATGIGVIVGGMIRLAGQGYDRQFGLAAVLLSLAGSALGMLLAGCWLLAMESEGAAFADLVVALTPGLITQIYHVMLTPVNLAYCGGAIVSAYWLSIRRMKREELAMCAVDEKPAQDKGTSWPA